MKLNIDCLQKEKQSTVQNNLVLFVYRWLMMHANSPHALQHSAIE